jgi:AAA+ superfamily predicted ATPase
MGSDRIRRGTLNENDMIAADRKLPRVASARLLKDHIFEVIWSKGDRRGKSDVVNLLVLINSFKVFRSLRNKITLERLVAEQARQAAQAALTTQFDNTSRWSPSHLPQRVRSHL